MTQRLLLRQIGTLNYEVEVCGSAEEALAISPEERPRLILCDWNLPGRSGLELCQLLREESVYSYILLLTGEEAAESKLRALDAGADAFLAKPASLGDLRAHLEIGRRILSLQSRLEERLQQLQKANQDLQVAEESRDRSQREAREVEVRVAAQVQSRLLVSTPPSDPFLDLAAISLPSAQVDGDFLDFFRHERGLDVVVGDVMGKGIPAALLGAGVKTQWMRILAESPGSDLALQVTRLNHRIAPDLTSLESFVTLFSARFDLATRQLEFVDAGHTKPLLFRAQGQDIEVLEGPNFPLGFDSAETYSLQKLDLEVGDLLLVFSDGLTEAVNDQGEPWGIEGLRASLLAAGPQSATRTLEMVMADFQRFRGERSGGDDISLVAVRVDHLPKPGPLHLAALECRAGLSQLAEIREFIGSQLARFGVTVGEVWAYEFLLAATELASNLVRHAYAGKTHGYLHLLMSIYEASVRLRFYHGGQPLPEELRQAPELDAPQEGGMGLFILSQVCDGLLYGQQGPHHWVEMRKNL